MTSILILIPVQRATTNTRILQKADEKKFRLIFEHWRLVSVFGLSRSESYSSIRVLRVLFELASRNRHYYWVTDCFTSRSSCLQERGKAFQVASSTRHQRYRAVIGLKNEPTEHCFFSSWKGTAGWRLSRLGQKLYRLSLWTRCSHTCSCADFADISWPHTFRDHCQVPPVQGG